MKKFISWFTCHLEWWLIAYQAQAQNISIECLLYMFGVAVKMIKKSVQTDVIFQRLLCYKKWTEYED